MSVLALVLAAAAVAAGQSAAAAKPKAWAGSITYEETGHLVLHDGREIHDFHRTLSIELDGHGPAHAEGAYSETIQYLGRCDPGPHLRVDTEEGNASGKIPVQVLFAGQVRPRTLYQIVVGNLEIATTTSSVSRGGCGDSELHGTGSQVIGNLPISGRVKEGLVLSGKETENVLTQDPCSGIADCSVTETLTWSLSPPATKFTIAAAALYDRDPYWKRGGGGKQFTKLVYLSASPHPYYSFGGGGQTRIYGTLELRGPPGDELDRLSLEVLEDGREVATARITLDGALALFGKAFGEDGTIALEKPEFLFRLPASQARHVDQTHDGTLALRIRARTNAGSEATYDWGEVTKLVLYDDNNRYGQRDAAYGGDGWARPSTIDAVRHFRAIEPDLLLGDFSNMNGGRFWPHADHSDGLNADAYVEGYSIDACLDLPPGQQGPPSCLKAVTDLAATKIVHLLNDPEYGPRVHHVFVTYFDWAPLSAFNDAIRDITLADGRKAVDVILVAQEHDTHFHLQFYAPD